MYVRLVIIKADGYTYGQHNNKSIQINICVEKYRFMHVENDTHYLFCCMAKRAFF